MANLAIFAAGLHMHEVQHKIHGYTQGNGRNGSGGTETVTVQGKQFTIAKGDRDCSSSAIEVWQKVLEITPYKGVLDSATYTGNMLPVFKASGLFDVWTYSKRNLAKAKPGDILLNVKHHTGIYQGNGKVSEFLFNEKGTITGGKVGDQTGRESQVRSVSAYGSGWQYILHYNGKANPADNYEILLSTNVRTGRDTKRYRIVSKLNKGDVVSVDKTIKDKKGKVWGHLSGTKYCWFVISGKATRAKITA